MGIATEIEPVSKIQKLSPEELQFPGAPVVGLVAGCASGLEGIPVIVRNGVVGAVNMLILPAVGGLERPRILNGPLVARRAVLLRANQLVPVEFSTPVRVDALDFGGVRHEPIFDEIERCGALALNSSAALRFCSDKIATGRALLHAGIPTPSFTVATAEMSRAELLERRLELLSRPQLEDCRELVCKPNDGMMGTHVVFVPKGDEEAYLRAVARVTATGSLCVVQPRLVTERTDASGRPIDLNFRVLATWQGGEPLSNERMIEVRHRGLSNAPANVARGARPCLVDQLQDLLRVPASKVTALTRRAVEIVRESMKVLEASITEKAGPGRHAGLVGWDLQLGPRDELYVLEPNVGTVGGADIIERLSATKGAALTPIARHLASLARENFQRAPRSMESVDSIPVSTATERVSGMNLGFLLLAHGSKDTFGPMAAKIMEELSIDAGTARIAALLHLKDGNTDAALAVLSRAASVDDHSETSRCLVLRARILRDRGEIETASRHLESAYALAPLVAEVQREYALDLLANGQNVKALSIYDRALADDPFNTEASKGRTFALVALKRDEEAIQQAREALLADIADPSLADFLRDVDTCLPGSRIPDVVDGLEISNPESDWRLMTYQAEFGATARRESLLGFATDAAMSEPSEGGEELPVPLTSHLRALAAVTLARFAGRLGPFEDLPQAAAVNSVTASIFDGGAMEGETKRPRSQAAGHTTNPPGDSKFE